MGLVRASDDSCNNAAAQRYVATIDFEAVSSSLAGAERALSQYERFSANSALVGEMIARALARSSAVTVPASPVYANLQLPSFLDVKIPEIPLYSTRIHELATLNGAVALAISSVHFDGLAASEQSLGRRLVALSDSYRDIFTYLPENDFVVPELVIDLPPRDMIVKSTIVSSRATDFEPSEAKIDLNDPAYARLDVDLMLAELSPDYVALLDEVSEVLSGRSSGRVRHVLVSMRELITRVLHDLSPDDEFRAWSTDLKYFDKGKPTRAARHLYVCRFVNCGPYSDYVKKSSEMTVAFFKALNGLHDVRPDIGEFQLRLMVTDALNLLRFLLRTAKYRP